MARQGKKKQHKHCKHNMNTRSYTAGIKANKQDNRVTAELRQQLPHGTDILNVSIFIISQPEFFCIIFFLLCHMPQARNMETMQESIDSIRPYNRTR